MSCRVGTAAHRAFQRGRIGAFDVVATGQQTGRDPHRRAAQAGRWVADGEAFDRVILAISASDAARSVVEWSQHVPDSIASSLRSWAASAQALHHEAITSVYAQAANGLSRPMLALPATPRHPAQFVKARAPDAAGSGRQFSARLKDQKLAVELLNIFTISRRQALGEGGDEQHKRRNQRDNHRNEQIATAASPHLLDGQVEGHGGYCPPNSTTAVMFHSRRGSFWVGLTTTL